MRVAPARTPRPTLSPHPHARRPRALHRSVPRAIMSPHLGSLTGASAVLTIAALVDVAIQLVGWGVSVAARTEKLYDGTGSLTFILLTIGSLVLGGSYAPRQIAVTCCVVLWALRLGGLLVYRVVKTGGDSRFEQALKSPALYLVYWLMQAAWIFVTLSATLWLNGSGPPSSVPVFWGSDVVGALLFAVGFTLEATADAQKLVWKLDPQNKGRWIDSGLWSLARFPQYFGEMTLWWGIWLLAAPSFGRSGAWATVAGPLFVMLLLLKVSGIPLQEQQAAARWGDDAAYKAYVARTRLLVPLPKFGRGGDGDGGEDGGGAAAAR